MSRVDLTVVAPCFNEARNLPELVLRLTRVFEMKALNGQIVLVDDGSRDDTGRVIDDLGARHAHVTPVHHGTNRGIAAGWDSGVARAEGEYVCLIDADLQYLPEDVWRLYREIRHTHADMVQGYRSTIGRLRDSRYILSKGLNLALNVLFGMSLRDNKSGFVIAPRDTLRDVLSHRFRYNYFQTFITVAAKAKGYSVREIETLFGSRLLGHSFIPRVPWRIVTGALADLAKGFVEFRLARRERRDLEEFIAEHPPRRVDEPLPAWRRARLGLYVRTMPLHAWMLSGRVGQCYEELKQTQWLAPDDVRTLQESRLRRIVRHAYHHVSFYRERFDALNIRPGDIRSLEDLARLPFLEKGDVRTHLHFDLLADNRDNRKIQRIATSGSTGEPFVCYADRHQLEMRWAATLRSMEWTGYRFGDRQARLWHQTIGMTGTQVLRERIDAWLSSRIFIPAFEMSEADVARALRRLERHRPVLVDGYAECFNLLARYARSHGGAGVRPKGVISSAQVLPPESRAAIEQAFETRVFDKYGSREFSGIAYECEAHDGHHVVAESYIVEILRDGRPARPGELGEVVVTDLNNQCVPFLRYRIGDLAVAMDDRDACACGRGLPRIGRIEGRVQSIVLGQGGRAVPGSLFLHLFKDYDYMIRHFQVVQKERGAVVLRVVRAARFDDGTFAALVGTLQSFLGAGTRIDVEFVEEIPMVRTGKRQSVVSELPLDFQSLGDDVASRVPE